MSGATTYSFAQVASALPNGTSQTCEMLAHHYATLEVTTWDLLGPFVVVFAGSKSKVDVHQLVIHHEVAWVALSQRCGLQLEEMFFPSFNSVSRSIRREGELSSTELTRDSWTCETKALVLFLCHCVRDCRNPSFKLQASGLLLAWLTRVVDIARIDPTIDEAFELNSAKCLLVDEDGVCSHLLDVVTTLGQEDECAPHSRMCKLLIKLSEGVFICDSIAGTLGSIVFALAEHIHGRVDDVDATKDPLKTSVARVRGGRRRNYEQAFKAELASGLLLRQRALLGSGESKVQGVDRRRLRDWQCREEMEMLVRLRRIQHEGTWCLAEDAAKLGKPALEIKTFAILRPGSSEGGWMLNQAAGAAPASFICSWTVTAV
jgi:hypothetical protein